MNNNDLSSYMNTAIENLVANVIKSTLQNPKETAFLMQYRKSSKKAMQKRLDWEAKGKHIPSFLISSITHSCNLFCKGCYARANGICAEKNTETMLTDSEWESIFGQASELGIGFHLLAGGEPLLRRDVILKAASTPDTIYPIFTNGIMIDDSYYELFDRCRNLIPVISIEGNEQHTDERRGQGIYCRILEKMHGLKKNKILFGASITVTTENLNEVTSVEFMHLLQSLGCCLVFFIEYVPVNVSTKHLAFSEKERHDLEERQAQLREQFETMIFLSFPGDEKYMGGCLAAGRGFFHINPYGAAEACPFSPYSDRNLKEYRLLEVLQSPFFQKLQAEKFVGSEHEGGCALFEQEAKIKSLLCDC